MFKYVKFTRLEKDGTVYEFRAQKDDVEVIAIDGDAVALKYESEDAVNALIASQSNLITAVEITYEEFKVIAQKSAQYARIKKRVEEKYNAEVCDIANQYTLHERETWAIQLEQAKAYKQSGDELDAPFLKVLADAEGATVAAFADAVILKANAYEAFMAQALANKRAYERELMAEIGL